MKLITEVTIPDYPFELDHNSPLMMLGSCFTEEIGRFLFNYLFPVCINPFGVTYNPGSVLKGLQSLTTKENYTAEDLRYYNGLWFSFDHYTRFSDPDKEKTLERINLRFHEAKEMLDKAALLIITWGTAWVYRHGKERKVVNNCHKLPAGEFVRERLRPAQVVDRYAPFLEDLFKQKPGLKVLFTVSPVRHWKDGAHGNQLSKATLLLAADDLVRSFPNHCFYFPSYEMVMDEMRDYRFYGTDLIHPNETATRYIWERFRKALITERSEKIINELEPLLKLKGHRPVRPSGSGQIRMEEKKASLQRGLRDQYPHLSWKNWSDSNT
jgi:hypothetical protein